MKTKRVGWLLIFLSYVGVVLAQNLDDQERRWAISGSWGGNWPIVTKNTLSGKAVSAGHIHTLMLEYYIPYTRFSLKGGYTGEEIGLNPGISASMSNLEIGGRYYFLPQRFAIQPYGGLSTGWNLSPRRQEGWAVAVITILQGKSFVKITIIDTELKNHYSQFLLWWELIYIFFLVLLSPWNIISGWALPER